ncbi:MAG: hypothetical protein MZV70_37060 [Desulfobacterales bacterium]|nr:hypothetical protein [Desulfobacterales bacterium]
MLTTESANEKKDAGKQAGATGWIVKPFKPEQLIAVVKKLAGVRNANIFTTLRTGLWSTERPVQGRGIRAP